MKNGKQPTLTDTHKIANVAELPKESPKNSAIEQMQSTKESTKSVQPEKSVTTEKSVAAEKTKVAEKSSVTEKLQNQKIEPPLTPLEKMAVSLINNREPQTDPNPTVTLSRFGLKSSNDVITFIRSPAGKTVLAEISDNIALQKAIQNQQQLAAREHDILMHRLRAAMFLWFLNKRAHAKAHAREIAEEQNHKAIENAKSHTPAATKTVSVPKIDPNLELLKSIQDYENAIRANEAQRQALRSQGLDLASQLSHLEDQLEMQDFKYKVIDSELEENVPLLELLEKNDPQSLEEAKTQIDELNERSEKLVMQASELFDKGQFQEGQLLLQQNTAVVARLGEIHDVREVLEGNKYFADEHGNEVSSFKDAHYVLKVHKTPALDENGTEIPGKHHCAKCKIHKHDGKGYFLEHDEDWETVDKQKAQEKFQRLQPQMLNVQKVVNHNKTLEAEQTISQIKDVKGKMDTNKEEEMLLANQDVIMKAALSSAQKMVNQPELGLTPTPKPVPMQTVTAAPNTPKPSVSTGQVSNTTQFFKNEMEKIKSVTPMDLMKIAQDSPGTNKQADLAFLKEQYSKMKLDFTKTIPPTAMTFLLKNLPSIAGAPKNPTVTPPTPEPAPTSTAPSPFLTKMTPF